VQPNVYRVLAGSILWCSIIKIYDFTAFDLGKGKEVGSADGSALKIKGLFFRSYEIVALK
jgi:hypothetical protein